MILNNFMFILQSYIAYIDMKEDLKLVDKYELLKQNRQTIDGVKYIPARHTVQDKMYTIKKIKLNDENKNKYAALINQIHILKQIRDQRVIMCHKIIKTSTSTYISYDYMTDNTLQSFIQIQRITLGYKQKLKIALKLAQFFLFLKTHNIVNLSIKPSNIEVLYKHDKEQKELRFNNFQYAIEIFKPLSQVIIKNVPVSQFVPKQIFGKEALINHSCSIYILGKLFQFLQFDKQNLKSIDKSDQNFIQTIIHTIQKMITEKQIKRPTLQEIIHLLKNVQNKQPLINQIHNQKSANDLYLNTHSHQKPILVKTKSAQILTMGCRLEKKSVEKQYQEECKKKFNQYCLMIIKARNLSMFLLKCCQVFLKIDFVQIDSLVEISFLYLKQSTSIMNQLHKLLTNGRHKDIIIHSKQFNLFSKSTDFFRLQTIISKDLNFLKKYLNQMLVSILQDYQNLLQCSDFKKETSNNDVQQSFLKLKTILLLKNIMQNYRFKSISKESLKHLHILSYLISFDNFEEMFKQLINQEILELERQTLFISAGQLDHEALVVKMPEIQKYLAEKTLEL